MKALMNLFKKSYLIMEFMSIYLIIIITMTMVILFCIFPEHIALSLKNGVSIKF